jgi:hypothetical protein
LTVISKVNEVQIQLNKHVSVIYKLNLFLIAVVFVGLIGYIFLSNQIVSNKYASKVLKQKVDQFGVSVELNGISSSDGISLVSLNEFAENKGMVIATDTASYFESSGVAINDSY